MKAGLVLPRSRIIIPKPPSRIKLDMAFAVGAGAELKDKSRYRSAGAIVGPDWADGVHGKCLDFDPTGPDYVEIPVTHTQLDFTSEDFSIIARVKFDDLSIIRTIYCRGLLNTDGIEWEIGLGGRLEFFTSQTPVSQRTRTGAGVIGVNTWYTVGMSRSGANVKMYRNGIDVLPIPGVHIDPDPANRAAVIGALSVGFGNPFDGKIEFLRVFGGIALSASEHLAYHRALA